MKYLVIIILLLILPMIWLSSCNKNSSETDYNPNVSASKDYIRAEDAILEIVNSFFKGLRDTLVINHGYGYIDACDVSYHPATNSLDFGYGAVDRLCQDNKFRKGLFSATFTGPLFYDWVTADIETDSLFVDDYLIEASIQIQNMGMNGNNLPEFSLKVNSSNIMLPDTTKINGVKLTTNFLLIWAEGSLTPTVHEDDLYLITGGATGLSSDGIEFATEVLDTLYNYADCFWIARGINQITVPSASIQTGEIDYITDDGCFNEMHFYFNDNLFYDIIK
jgi:hypothetical protein